MPVARLFFDRGQQQGADRRLSPTFIKITNGMLARDGQLRPRPALTEQAATVFGGGTFVAYDLATFNDRLVALGESAAHGYPTDLFEIVEGAGARWRPTVPGLTGARLPRATGLRDLGLAPDQEGGVDSFGAAASSGFVLLVYTSADGDEGYAHVVKADTGQTVLYQTLPSASSAPVANLRAVGLSDRLLVVGTNALAGLISASRFTPASDTSTQLLGTLITSNVTALQVAKVGDVDQFVVAYANTANEVVVRRFDSSGTLQVPSGGQYATMAAVGVVASIAVEADSSSDQLTVAFTLGTSVRMHTFNLTTGAQIGAGPFQPFSGDTAGGQLFLVRAGADLLHVGASIQRTGATDEPRVKVRPYTPSTNTLGTTATVTNARLASSAVFDDGDTIFAIRPGSDADSQATMLIALRVADGDSAITPLFAKDLEVSTSGTGPTPDLAVDASTGKLYLSSATLAADLEATPRVTEFEISSSERRQMAQIGNSLVISGGCPVIWDGHHLAELGFLTRPRIVSVTPGSAGSLEPGATYIYRQIWEHLDSDDSIIRSAVSEDSEQEMATGEDSNTVLSEAPVTLRCNTSAGARSTVRIKTYRTVATREDTAAAISARNGTDPPSSSLNGLNLLIFVLDDTGVQLFTVTFDAGSTDTDAIVDDVNAVTAGRVTATNVAGFLVLTLDDSGAGRQLVMYPGTANSVFGFIDYEFDEGTTELTTGEIFHLCNTTYVDPTQPMGTFVEVVDTMSDDTLREQQILYTQADGSPLHHFAPPPFDRIGGDGVRAAIAGLPRRDRYQLAKPLAANQSLQFSSAGIDAFVGRVRGDIEAIVCRASQIVAFTPQEIWALDGQGPDRAGRNGFLRPRLVYGEGGLRRNGWRSIVSFTDGTAFQLADAKIYLLPAGGRPEWISYPVTDTLESFPIVVAACHVKARQSLVFACQSSDGLSGCLLRYDLRKRQWFQDDIGPVSALAEYQGRVAAVIGGEVYLEDEGFGEGSLPTLTVRIGDLHQEGVGSQEIQRIALLGEIRGACTVEGRISYDGQTYRTLGTHTVSGSAGSPLELEWTPAEDICSRASLELVISSATPDSGGVWLNELDVYWEPHGGLPRLSTSRSR